MVNNQVVERPVGTRRVDPFVKKLNAGPRSIFQCPGPYTLQVAEFSGRNSLVTHLGGPPPSRTTRPSGRARC
jgi:hypothetical protein